MGATGTIDFSQYADKPAQSIDFSGYADKAAEQKSLSNEQPKGLLDRDIPNDSYTNATLSGLQSIGRGVRDFGHGLYDTFLKPPEGTAEKALTAVPGGVQMKRMVQGTASMLAPLAQLPQVPGAVRDINQSPDPTSVYGKVAQDTAGEGAGQALGALAMEAPGAIGKALPSKTRAGTGLNILESDRYYGKTPINPSGAMSTINRFTDELAPTPSVKLHPILEDLQQRVATSDMANSHPEIAQQLAAQGLPTQNPLTFKEARSFLKRINEAKEGATGVNYNALASTADALSRDIHAGAESAGFGQDYRNQVNEYRRGSTLENMADLRPKEVARKLLKELPRKVVGAVVNRDAVPQLAAPPEVPSQSIADTAPQTATPVEPTFERRSAAAERARIDSMTPDQRHQALFVDQLTGMPNARALSVAGPAPASAISDVAGLKWLNDNIGMQAGNELLKAKADALRQSGLDSYRLGDSGDEFVHRGRTTAELQQGLQRANQALGNMKFEATAPDGTTYEISGASFRHGVGQTSAEAEVGLQTAKTTDKANLRGKQGNLKILPKPQPPPSGIVEQAQ